MGNTEVLVVKEPPELVVTTIMPESVSTAPLELVVIHVEVYVVKGGGITDVVVVKEPSVPAVTITTPESVSSLPSLLVVVQVDV